MMLIVISIVTEKGEPRSSGGSQTQHQSQEDPRGKDEKANAKGGILETT